MVDKYTNKDCKVDNDANLLYSDIDIDEDINKYVKDDDNIKFGLCEDY